MFVATNELHGKTMVENCFLDTIFTEADELRACFEIGP